MAEAWQTPRGARPNRRGELARLAERVRKDALSSVRRKPPEERPSGRSLDPGREAGARGMIVTVLMRSHGQKWPLYASVPHKIRLTGSSAAFVN
jgi:hypothetical protein